MVTRATLASMNPIALIEVTAAARRTLRGALPTDPVVPNRTTGTAAPRRNWRSASSMLAAVRRMALLRHDRSGHERLATARGASAPQGAVPARATDATRCPMFVEAAVWFIPACWLGPRAGESAGPTLDDLDWRRGPVGIDLGSAWTLDKIGSVPVQSVPVQNSWDVAIRTQSRSPRWPRRQACRA